MASMALRITSKSISPRLTLTFDDAPCCRLASSSGFYRLPDQPVNNVNLSTSSASANRTRRFLSQVPLHATTAPSRETLKSQSSLSFDVVIIGAGIIGLTIARQFLLFSDLSVAILDAAVPCAGATGAGQGYIWRINKTPGAEKWELASRSHQLWVNLADSLQHQGLNPLQILGWMKTDY